MADIAALRALAMETATKLTQKRAAEQGLPAPSPQLSAPPVKRPRTEIDPEIRKTKFCQYFHQGTCFWGDGCNYAHSKEELRCLPGTNLVASNSEAAACAVDGTFPPPPPPPPLPVPPPPTALHPTACVGAEGDGVASEAASMPPPGVPTMPPPPPSAPSVGLVMPPPPATPAMPPPPATPALSQLQQQQQFSLDEGVESDDFEVIEIPDEVIGLVIGKGGYRIKEVEAECGVNVKVGKLVNGGMRKIAVAGKQAQREKASGLLLALSKRMEKVEEEVECPGSFLGVLIGKKGVNCKMIQDVYGVKLDVERDPDNDKAIIKICGSREGSSMAKQRLQYLLLDCHRRRGIFNTALEEQFAGVPVEKLPLLDAAEFAEASAAASAPLAASDSMMTAAEEEGLTPGAQKTENEATFLAPAETVAQLEAAPSASEAASVPPAVGAESSGGMGDTLAQTQARAENPAPALQKDGSGCAGELRQQDRQHHQPNLQQFQQQLSGTVGQLNALDEVALHFLKDPMCVAYYKTIRNCCYAAASDVSAAGA
eukprot:TRINITY_DN13102_c0_g1_i2.p1 TRINITY_DN13102_c0_g1~~TRINITY_DN13102_c0_g1_i2.p1  ORF type:complete len:569 (+),score=129.05 TRINITY_DN13102_c0_g1_i2:85-1707(+)